MKLISHCLTAVLQLAGIRSLIRFSKLSPPSQFSALPPVIIYNASPKAISGRTSYLRVRLEFLRYPQVIAGHCNERAFGPPTASTPSSACSWIGHTVSGLWPLTRRALNTRFPFASGTEYLKLASDYNSPDHSTKGTRSHFNVLSVLVSTRFQVLFLSVIR